MNQGTLNDLTTFLESLRNRLEVGRTWLVEAEAEVAMSRGGMTLGSNVLKVPHHGSKTSTTDSFLERVSPEIVVISVGSSNPYGHPNPGVLARLRETVEPANIYRTDQHGSIEIVSDGANIWVKTGDR